MLHLAPMLHHKTPMMPVVAAKEHQAIDAQPNDQRPVILGGRQQGAKGQAGTYRVVKRGKHKPTRSSSKRQAAGHYTSIKLRNVQ